MKGRFSTVSNTRWHSPGGSGARKCLCCAHLYSPLNRSTGQVTITHIHAQLSLSLHLSRNIVNHDPSTKLKIIKLVIEHNLKVDDMKFLRNHFSEIHFRKCRLLDVGRRTVLSLISVFYTKSRWNLYPNSGKTSNPANRGQTISNAISEQWIRSILGTPPSIRRHLAPLYLVFFTFKYATRGGRIYVFTC